MSILSFPACLVGRHRPRNGTVRWDGLNHAGECRGCSKPIFRDRHGRWRVRQSGEHIIFAMHSQDVEEEA